jgi:hypothetical protein
MMSLPLAHVAGIPIEEALGSITPGAARRVRGRVRDPPRSLAPGALTGRPPEGHSDDTPQRLVDVPRQVVSG